MTEDTVQCIHALCSVSDINSPAHTAVC